MPKIVIEGIDGSGKTSVSELIRDRIKGNLISSSQISFLPSIRKHANSDTTNTLARFVYYLAVNKYTVDMLANDASKTYIFDRYIYSTLTTHIALDKLYNNGKNIENFQNIFSQESGNFYVPETIVFLYIEPGARRLRLGLRPIKEDSKLDLMMNKRLLSILV